MDWPPGAHASTFGGNPVCIAAALATLRLLESQYIENARRMGEYIFGRLAGWRDEFRIVGDVRGKGLMIGIEIVKDRKTKEPAPELRDAIVNRAFTKGLAGARRRRKHAAPLSAAGDRRGAGRLRHSHARRMHSRSGEVV